MEILALVGSILAAVLVAAWLFDRTREREGRGRFSEGLERRTHIRSDVREEMLQQVGEARAPGRKDPDR